MRFVLTIWHHLFQSTLTFVIIFLEVLQGLNLIIIILHSNWSNQNSNQHFQVYSKQCHIKVPELAPHQIQSIIQNSLFSFYLFNQVTMIITLLHKKYILPDVENAWFPCF